MTTAYSYIRFSTKAQMQGHSLERQLEQSQKYCDAYGLTLSNDSYQDLGISAFSEVDRPSLSDMLEAVRTNKIKSGDYILIENVDRLSRQGIRKTLDVIYAIIEKGVLIVTLQDELILKKGSEDDLISVIRIAVNADLAHQESKKKSKRLSSVWAKKHRDAVEFKKPKTTRCPAWLRLSDDRSEYFAISEKVKTIKIIFSMLSNGVGKKSIAVFLNKNSVPHISNLTNTSGIWYPSYIDKIAKSHAVLGYFVPSIKKDGKRVLDYSDKIEGYFPKIIDDELFYQVKKMREYNASSQGRKGISFSNLLQGIATCKHCKSSLQYINKGNTDLYLKCSRAVLGLCDNKTLFRYKLIEYAVLELISSEDLQRYLKPEPSTDDSKYIQNLEVDIAKLSDDLIYFTGLERNSIIDGKTKELSRKLSVKEQELENHKSLAIEEKGALALESDIDFGSLISDVVGGDIEIRAKVNSYLRRKCRIICDNLQDIEFGLLSKVLGIEDNYIPVVRMSLDRSKLTVFMDATENEPEEAVFHLKETNGKIAKIRG